MRFSLVLATLERVSDVKALLESLTSQTFQDFEIIIVDQNDDERLAVVLDAFKAQLNIKWMRSEICNNSHARNLGLKIASGEIVAFPDDDCLYPPDILARVDTVFKINADLAFLTGPSVTYSGTLGSGRWEKKSCNINLRTVWTTVTEFNLFIKASWTKLAGGFDDKFGLGARFGSAEGIDLVLRIIKAGGDGFYDYDLKILHPDKRFSVAPVSRAFRYGTGLGQVLKKHQIDVTIVLNFFIRPIGGVIVNILTLNFLAANYHWQTLRGRVYGYSVKQGD